MRFLALIFILLPFNAQAVITIQNNNFGATTSNSSITENILTIWGGGSGQNPCAASTTCNSCTLNSDAYADCNTRQVGTNVRIRIEFTSDVEYSGTTFIKDSGQDPLPGTTNTYTQGQTAFVEVNWGDLCDAINDGDSACTETGSGDFTFGVTNSSDTTQTDTFQFKVNIINTKVANNCDNNTQNDGILDVGILDYSAFMGDEKVFFPSASDNKVDVPIQLCDFKDENGNVVEAPPIGGNITNLIAFHSEVDLESANTKGESQRINFSGGTYPNVELDPPSIDGFTNDVPVFTRLAIQDEAGNIMGVTPQAIAPENPGDPCSDINSGSEFSQIFACKYSTVPLEVVGLLEDDVNCFIATAAYGSNMHSTVQDFRTFRSQILLKSKLGTWLVKKYYKWGSYLSHYIIKYPVLKKISRVLLFPFWLFSILSIKMGVLLTSLLSVISLFSIVLLLKKLILNKGARV